MLITDLMCASDFSLVFGVMETIFIDSAIKNKPKGSALQYLNMRTKHSLVLIYIFNLGQ